MAVIQLQNELARLRVDILNTQAHNDRLKEALQLLDTDLRGKMDTISKYEVGGAVLHQEVEVCCPPAVVRWAYKWTQCGLCLGGSWSASMQSQ